jgi:thermostable 8-oxoguanine DNA glycosylase
MTQTAAIFSKVGAVRLELPSSDIEVLPGVRWGSVDAFPTPAYWVYQVFHKRLQGGPPQYKLGRTLAEEVGACLLGGHGIPAAVGIAAFERLRAHGAFACETASQEQLRQWLQEPLRVGDKAVRYRFAAQKAKYLSASLTALRQHPEFDTGRALRNWLVTLPGIGLKTASWVARNWLSADDVAILDIHIVRFGQAIGLFPPGMTVERNYLELEELFLEFSRRVDVRASELDAVIWYEMANSPLTVRTLVNTLEDSDVSTGKLPSKVRQLPLLA